MQRRPKSMGGSSKGPRRGKGAEASPRSKARQQLGKGKAQARGRAKARARRPKEASGPAAQGIPKRISRRLDIYPPNIDSCNIS